MDPRSESTPAPQSESSSASQSSTSDGSPKFGRLLLFLIFAVLCIGLLTWATEAYYS